MSNKVLRQVTDAVVELVKRPEFVAWAREEKLGEGLVLVNNSFIYRQKLKTNKSPYYLAIPFGADAAGDTIALKVVSGLHFNTDFKFVAKKAIQKLHVEELPQAIERELRGLGKIVMVLIGQIIDRVKTTEQIGHSVFSEVQLDPTSKAAVSVAGKTVTVNSVADDEAIWEELGRLHGEPLPADLSEPLSTALESIRKNHYAVLKLPDRKVAENPLLDSFVAALEKSVESYERALDVSKGVPTTRNTEFNDMLRIAYNFAQDAVLVVRLLVSVCDLKPIVRWCSVDQWFRLADDFRSLPWSKLKQKPSLDAYQQTINAARNRAFHRLLPVDNTLHVQLAGESLGPVTLRLFPEYLNRNAEENMDFEDRALVEILSDFTRVGERSVSPQFWHRNLEVMRGTIDLLSRTSATLMLLESA